MCRPEWGGGRLLLNTMTVVCVAASVGGGEIASEHHDSGYVATSAVGGREEIASEHDDGAMCGGLSYSN